jgi:carbamate kinase
MHLSGNKFRINYILINGDTMITNIMVSLGGNAILKHSDKGTAEEQLENTRKTSDVIVKLLKNDYHIAITHGNGPQVGDILLVYDRSKDTIPPMPLDVCVAQTQGMIGYMLQISLQNALKDSGIEKTVVSIITQTMVHQEDLLLQKPSKPIGPFYTALEASKYREQTDWTIVEDSGRGYRRVVPSPLPIGFVEQYSIKSLFDSGDVVIAAGGGGIPVIEKKDGNFQGIEAVVDKDHTAALLASLLNTEILLILTDVDKVALNYGKPDQKDLDHLTINEAKKYLNLGFFPSGNMGPKIESTINFLENGGKKAIITSIENVFDALEGVAGTIITPN